VRRSNWLAVLLAMFIAGPVSSHQLQASPIKARPMATAYIAIIIDDLGNHLARGKRAVALPAMLTYAVLPHTRYGGQLAELAFQNGKEVMLHMPMANLGTQAIGPGGLTLNLNEAEFNQTLNLALQQIPHVRGINNHMGSRLTQEPLQMHWLMAAIKTHKLFFIDSRTTPDTVASTLAKQAQIRTASRDIFLDNEPTFFSIDMAFKALMAKARRDGTAIAIGHPYPMTLDYLDMVLPQLAEQQIEVLPASILIAHQLSRRPLQMNLQRAALGP
jgi:polysaccharide deacetylase 2 family uncharacterized protein YibQ